MKQYITINGISNMEIKVDIVGELPLLFSNDSYEEISILGKDGSYYRKTGKEDINFDLEFNFLHDEELNIREFEIKKWIRNAKTLVMSNNNEFYYKIKKIVVSNIETELFWKGTFTINFTVAPYKYVIDNRYKEISKGDILFNPYESSYPIIKVEGAGNINLFVNGKQFTLKNVTDPLVINSEATRIYTIDKLPAGEKMIGYFPILEEGKNIIDWEGNVIKLEILPNWRAS